MTDKEMTYKAKYIRLLHRKFRLMKDIKGKMDRLLSLVNADPDNAFEKALQDELRLNRAIRYDVYKEILTYLEDMVV